jgi:hypothetical protein
VGKKLRGKAIRSAVFVIILSIIAFWVLQLKSPNIGQAQPPGAPPGVPAPALGASGTIAATAVHKPPERPTGVCPPFKLRDDQGQVIDPVHGINDKAPYSPKQTCGACHNYQLITEGFHLPRARVRRCPKNMRPAITGSCSRAITAATGAPRPLCIVNWPPRRTPRPG